MDSFIRKKCDLNVGEDLEFMTFSWESKDTSTGENKRNTFHIYVFGVDKHGRSVCLDIHGYTPFFYVKVPFDFTETDTMELKYQLQKALFYNRDALLSVTLVNKKDIDGFNNNKVFKFVRLVFSSEESMKRIIYLFQKPIEGFESIVFKVYDTKSGPVLTFTYIREILMCGWVKVDYNSLSETESLSRCQLCYSTFWKNVFPLEKADTASLVTLSFDIECYSVDGSFPDPSVDENTITQIGSGFCRQNSDSVLRHIIVLGKCSNVEGCIVESYDTESQVISAWVNLIEKTDPDLIIGYNIHDFDWKYISQRAEFLGMEEIISRMSRISKIKSEFKDDTFESNAFGMNYFRYIHIPGVNQFDLLHWFRKNKKLESYKLDDVSDTYLKNKKHPVTVKEIFELSGPGGTPDSRARIAAYCCQDTFLPIKLASMFNMVVNLIEMSKITRVPFMWLILRGETIKVHSQIAYTARKENYLIPMAQKRVADIPFEGATVLPPEIGAHLCPISGLDFASLYPSIMIAWNLCPTTFVKHKEFDNINGIEYSHFQWEGGNYKFVQNVPGLVPGILKNLWIERKKVKKQMESELVKAREYPEQQSHKMMASVLNGKQLAIKVSMNSIYGAFGSSNFSIPCKPISSTVTYNGRKMIEHSKTCAESWYDGSVQCGGVKAHVIYGDTDSIYTRFTIPGQENMSKETVMEKIWEISQICADRISKTFKAPIELEMEKIMWPMYLYGKKRYANLCYEKKRDENGKIYFDSKRDIKGIQAVRRDNCKLVKTVSECLFKELLYNIDIKEAKNVARSYVKDLLNNKIPVDQLVLSKSLKSSYIETSKAGHKITKPAHWFLAEKMKSRDPMTAPKSGDRVPYIFIQTSDKNVLQQDRVEDPDYAKENPKKCIPDVLYYLENQLMSPLYTIFEVIVTDANGNVFPRKVKKDGSTEISSTCKKEIARLLWEKELRSKQNRVRGNREITSYFSSSPSTTS